MTERQEGVLEYLRRYAARFGYPPTIREIGDNFGILWAAARNHLKALEKKGFIRLRPQRSRGIEILGKGVSPLAQDALTIPLVGKITAGEPILAHEEHEADIVIDKALFRSPDAFSLRVRGDSMVSAGIMDGDYVVVRPQSSVEDGQIAAVLINDDEATIKRVFFKGGRVVLKPENPRMEAIAFAPEDVSVIGKVIGVIRKIA